MLTLTTLELFPTEHRGMALNVTMSLGFVSGLGLPFLQGLSTSLLVVVILIFLSASVSVYFLRETKGEECLRNLYDEIYPETENEDLLDKNSY